MTILQRLVIPFFIVLLGFACAGAMVLGAPKALKEAPPAKIATVEVATLSRGTTLARVSASGEVRADQQVTITPEVSGRIRKVHPDLVPGARFPVNTTVAWIDARDYEAALVGEQARLQQARLELELEQRRQSTAVKEWALLGDDRPNHEAQLQLRKPYLALAEANVASAEASVGRAERNVGRTSLRMPFNALVISESVDVGQLVQPGTQAISVVSSDRVRIEVSVPVDRLAAIAVPGWNADKGSMVSVMQRSNDRIDRREGRVIGLGGQLDPSTRTALLIVAVDDPLQVAKGTLPLLPGAFVDVEIVGTAFEDVMTVPRAALVDGNAVWAVENGVLARHEVVIAWSGPSDVLIRDGLADGAQVVVSPLALPVVGMQVRVQEAMKAKAKAKSAAVDGEG